MNYLYMKNNYDRNSKNVKIVIIDSGIDVNHEVFNGKSFKGIYIKKNEHGKIIYDYGNISDDIGHGTSIAYIINKNVKDAEIFIIKLFNKEFETDVDELIASLEYCEKNLNPDIIHLSNGVTLCNDINKLKNTCNKLEEKGVIIVCAFDNDGSISYPAAFKNVIGVDISLSCIKTTDYEFVEDDILNIRAIGIEQRLPWLNNTYNKVAGASFAAPYITSFIAKIIKDGYKERKYILMELSKRSKKIYRNREFSDVPNDFYIDKAIVFPFNKEVTNMIRFTHLLKFKIVDLFDYKTMGNVNKKASSVLNMELINDFTVKNIDKLNWDDDFDTFILGHTRELCNALNKDLRYQLINKCLEHNKNLVAFDDLRVYPELFEKFKKKGLKIYFPYIDKEHVPKNRFGKLRCISKPVLGVFGTSSKQGKFTLQLKLREKFIEQGYKIGHLGTEPSSLLFNADEVYAMGYDSAIDVYEYDAISIINYLVGRIEDKDPDLIIVGSQSQTIPITTGNLAAYPISQHQLILGCQPDAYILCVNIFDDIDYINRTILYLESIISAKVIALVIFPLDRNIGWSILGNVSKKVDENALLIKKLELEKVLNKKTFILSNENEIKDLCNICIDYFS